MQHPVLAKKQSDWEYDRRHRRFYLIHLLTLFPLLCLGALLWAALGQQTLQWVPVVAGAYMVQLLGVEMLVRRETLAGMRREGIVDEDYRPPAF